MNTEPTMTVAMTTPNVVASARPIATGPRMSSRTRQSSSEVNRAVSNQAAIM